MSLPFFFLEDLQENRQEYVLPEETSKHMIQVLRMQVGEKIYLTNGFGLLAVAEIIDAHRKRCMVRMEKLEMMQRPSRQVTIAISPLKNSSRFEWFLEKSAEIGVSNIIPLMCKRTEKQQLRSERLQGILTSAMLQSKQCFACQLSAPTQLKDLIASAMPCRKLIAHCLPQQKNMLNNLIEAHADVLILIGPEGDFTEEEIDCCLKAGYEPVSLGENRLRTETAGMVAAALLCIG